MNNLKNITKRTNYRSWKSGKHWLYANVVLASIIGGIGMEMTGITPKILSYIQKDSAHTIVEAISSTAGVLPRGEILATDFYASVGDFRVPQTVGKDFANNATVAVKGAISPYFSGASFIIPSAKDSNAVAAFNQPLDPTKDFSISAEITVPDARVAAAGLYVSDVSPNDIVTKLGVGNINGAGSSGALGTDSSAYSGHYMLFSGFHNSVGYAAILASGTGYSRVGSNATSVGNSKYMDKDYVLLSTSVANRTNVKIWATADYNATTGTITMVYRHNSGTANAGVGQYDKSSKSAVVQFQVSRSSPIYLGVVGNGDDSGNLAADKRSSTTVTSVTGTYLTVDRRVEFKDDAGGILAPFSKVLMPRGGRLGIGNDDTTTPYYYDKPEMRQGYTYHANQNPSVGNDKNMVVVYKRDVQTGFVERINKLTGQKIEPSQNVTFKGVTEQSLSVKVPGISGYYYANEITGNAKNPVYATNGGTVDFNLLLDDTSNGTKTTDAQEQVVETYMMPSVQERILTITKPDGTVVVEKQTSTTGTDFAPLTGEYALPGYRAVIDGVVVSEEQAFQGIPSEATDKTDNLKATTDSSPQKRTVTYQAEPPKAMITYQDVTTGTILKTETISGQVDATIPYETAKDITAYRAKGYLVKASNFIDGSEKFDNDVSTNQTYLVELVRDSHIKSETKVIRHKVTYSVKHNLVTAPKDYMTEAKITHIYPIDQVTGAKITSKFKDYAFNGALDQNPHAPKYESDHLETDVTSNGEVSFASLIVPDIDGHISTISENSTVRYTDAKDGEELISSVLYQLDDMINVTLPTDTIFYHKATDIKVNAPTYTITNNSGLPVKVSVADFVAKKNNPALPTNFALNLDVSDNKGLISSAKLVENGAHQSSATDLITLANCLDQYAVDDTPITNGSTINNVATFTYGGAAMILKPLISEHTLSLKFEGVNF